MHGAVRSEPVRRGQARGGVEAGVRRVPGGEGDERQGGDERQQGVVQIKDLIEGKRASEAIEDNAAWREARVAQITVPEGELVAKVREMLDAQARDRDGAA